MAVPKTPRPRRDVMAPTRGCTSSFRAAVEAGAIISQDGKYLFPPRSGSGSRLCAHPGDSPARASTCGLVGCWQAERSPKKSLQVVVLSIQDFVQSLRGQARGANSVDGAALEARVLSLKRCRCRRRLLSLDFAATAALSARRSRHRPRARREGETASLVGPPQYSIRRLLSLSLAGARGGHPDTLPQGGKTELREACMTENLRSLRAVGCKLPRKLLAQA